MNAYRIRLQQHTKDGLLVDNAIVDVRARNAKEALRRAETHARTNGYVFQKTRPIEITGLEVLSSDLI